MATLSRREMLTGALALPALGAAASDPPPSAATPNAPIPPTDPFGTSLAPFVTQHRGTFGARTLDYTATMGPTVIADGQGHPTARFVATAYVESGGDRAARPVLFAFNGGPSAASVLLHSLALGPKRAAVVEEASGPTPPTHWIDNAHCVLDVADLVFVDPVETGFSRVLPAGKKDIFYSVNGDAQSVSGFLVAWIHANDRAKSPKYVLGESYGTMRAAVMAGQLAGVMPLDGVFLLGQAVNMIETSQRAKNALAYATNLTALAAVAAYHGRAKDSARTLEAIVDAAYAFGMSEYLQALVRGHDLPAGTRRRIAAQLEDFTGIPVSYYLEHDLAITKIAFAKELLKDRGRVLSIFDARFTTPVVESGAETHDPIYALFGPVSSLFQQRLTQELGVTVPTSEYRFVAPGTEDTWEWNGTLGPPGGPFLDFDYQARISEAFRANPRFRLGIGTGYHDLTTTIGPARYLVTRSDYPRDRVFQRQYLGGHMSYIHEPSLTAFSSDLRAWLSGGRPG